MAKTLLTAGVCALTGCTSFPGFANPYYLGDSASALDF